MANKKSFRTEDMDSLDAILYAFFADGSYVEHELSKLSAETEHAPALSPEEQERVRRRFRHILDTHLPPSSGEDPT